MISIAKNILESMNLDGLTKLLDDLGLPTDEINEAQEALRALCMNRIE